MLKPQRKLSPPVGRFCRLTSSASYQLLAEDSMLVTWSLRFVSGSVTVWVDAVRATDLRARRTPQQPAQQEPLAEVVNAVRRDKPVLGDLLLHAEGELLSVGMPSVSVNSVNANPEHRVPTGEGSGKGWRAGIKRCIASRASA